MNPSRMRALEASQTSIARKVLDCVPLREWWHSTDIERELYRQGVRPGIRIVEGCLASLRDQGLIREAQNNRYQRVEAKEEKVVPIAQNKQPAPAQDPEDQSPFAKLCRIAHVLRTVATEIDDLALELHNHQTSNDEELKKLQQLKTILRDLT
jgi:hypothetical protein